MRTFYAFMIMCLLAFCAMGQDQSTNTKYRKALADSLGADDYGMKRYVLVILKTGSGKAEGPERQKLFQGHMENIGRMASLGKLVIAGPLAANDKHYEGIFILNVKTAEEALVLLQTDPAVKAQLLEAEVYPWYGSAALPLYLKHHDEVKKKDF